MATELSNDEQPSNSLTRGMRSPTDDKQFREGFNGEIGDTHVTNMVAKLGRANGSLVETALIGALGPKTKEVQLPHGASLESDNNGVGIRGSTALADEKRSSRDAARERIRDAPLVGDSWEMEVEGDWEQKRVVAVGITEGKRVLEQKWGLLLKQGSPWASHDGIEKV